MRSLFSITLVVILFPANTPGATEETLNYGRFSAVTLYRTAPHPSHVVLFVSGDGGWNKGVVGMARERSSSDVLVAGIDITHYLRELRDSTEECSLVACCGV